ncbi:putative ribonuclease H-like domain-containing protein, partial [Tanacetum coccineum]
MNQFCRMKGIKREFSVARIPQQNRVVERKNRTLIEAARTMLEDSLLPTTFWAEVVSTACYVQNGVLVTKPHNKTPYELLHGNKDNGTQQYILLPLLYDSPQSSKDAVVDDAGYANNTNKDNTVSPSVSTTGQTFTTANDLPSDPLIPDLEDTDIFSGAYDDEDMGAEADLNNLEITMNVSPIPTTRIHKDHPKDQIIEDINSATQTRRMTMITEEHAI